MTCTTCNKKQQEGKFCNECGGILLADDTTQRISSFKYNKTIALILCIFFGLGGLHRFYVRKNKTGVLYACTGGLLFVGVLIDFFSILSGGFYDPEIVAEYEATREKRLSAWTIVFIALAVLFVLFVVVLREPFYTYAPPIVAVALLIYSPMLLVQLIIRACTPGEPLPIGTIVCFVFSLLAFFVLNPNL